MMIVEGLLLCAELHPGVMRGSLNVVRAKLTELAAKEKFVESDIPMEDVIGRINPRE